MLTALRRRLTLLMTALTSLVLAGALVVTWNYAAAQYRTCLLYTSPSPRD